MFSLIYNNVQSFWNFITGSFILLQKHNQINFYITISSINYFVRKIIALKKIKIADARWWFDKKCSHSLQSGHLAWWSADNCSDLLSQSEIHFRGEKQTSRENNSIIEKNNIICLLVFLACRLCPLRLKKMQNARDTYWKSVNS